MTILYYDCFAGISGDMHLAGLFDLGVDYDEWEQELNKLGIDGYEVQHGRASRKGISGTQVQVVVHSQPSEHRGLHQIERLITSSQLAESVKNRAIAVFRQLAEVEARIHNTTPDQIHFHEVGALDAIVDIVGGVIALELLNVEQVWCSPVELGGGVAHCEHGILPVPAPATLELLKDVPIKLGAVPFEATTPTGAVLLATFVDQFVIHPEFSINRIGYGIGHRDGAIPNVLRVCLGESSSQFDEQDNLCVLECNIDDMNPECYDYVLEQLFTVGAKDVWLTPVLMKKNRPATLLSVLCTPERVPHLTKLLLTETTTLGVRQSSVVRTALSRGFKSVTTCFGEVRVKIAYLHGRALRGKPEYEDCKRLALAQSVAIHTVYEAVRVKLAIEGLTLESSEVSKS